METSISFIDLLILVFYLGAITVLIGTVIFTYLIYRYGKNKKKSVIEIIILIFLQLLTTVLISVIIWKFWVFHTDVLIGFISIPSLIAEVVIIPVFYYSFRKWVVRS